jgi:hypothetical protein
LDSSASLNLKKCIRVAAMIFICLYANSFPKQMRGPAWSLKKALLNANGCLKKFWTRGNDRLPPGWRLMKLA